MKNYLSINRWDLNFILTIIGFPFFTMLISDSVASIAYRGFALIVALMCLKESGISFSRYPSSKGFFIVLLYVSLQSLYGVFLGEYSTYPYSGVKYMFLLFNIGILWIPLLAFVFGFERINWKKTLTITFFLLLITVGQADLRTYDVEASNSGRFDMGRLSTLAFGDNGAYLVLISLVLIATREQWLYKFKKLTIVILVFSILVGLFGVLKAGSRGPLLGCLTGFLFVTMCMTNKDRLVVIGSFVALIATGAVSLSKIEAFAPALYARFMLTVEEGDMSGREDLFDEAILKFQDNFLLGTNPVSLSPTQFSTCHNVYLETLEGGGIIIFAIFFFSFLKILLQSFKRREYLIHPGFLFLFSLFSFNAARGLSGIMLTSNPIYSFAFVGCGIAIYMIKKGNINVKY